jgi:hypothetical protein
MQRLQAAIDAARAAGYAEAKEQASDVAATASRRAADVARRMESSVIRGQWRKAYETAEDIATTIRAMESRKP